MLLYPELFKALAMVSSAVVVWKRLENISRGCRCHSTLSAGEAPFLESRFNNGSEEAKKEGKEIHRADRKAAGGDRVSLYAAALRTGRLADWQGATPHAVI